MFGMAQTNVWRRACAIGQVEERHFNNILSISRSLRRPSLGLESIQKSGVTDALLQSNLARLLNGIDAKPNKNMPESFAFRPYGDLKGFL